MAFNKCLLTFPWCLIGVFFDDLSVLVIHMPSRSSGCIVYVFIAFLEPISRNLKPKSSLQCIDLLICGRPISTFACATEGPCLFYHSLPWSSNHLGAYNRWRISCWWLQRRWEKPHTNIHAPPHAAPTFCNSFSRAHTLSSPSTSHCHAPIVLLRIFKSASRMHSPPNTLFMPSPRMGQFDLSTPVQNRFKPNFNLVQN